MVVAILAIIAVALLAAVALSRTTDSDTDRNETQSRLQRATEALDQFSQANHRLPCPANPVIDTGVEAITATGAATCAAVADEGTLPWKTLGLKREHSLDAWGDKISYRVHSGAGSLVQPEGVNMTECDTQDSGAATLAAGSAGRLCVSNPDPTLRSTSVANFLAGKGLNVDDNGRSPDNVAYLVMSHGKTGYGAWTTSGVRKAYSDVKGEELKNTSANGPFTIKPFSGVDVEANTTQHFDDLILYRTIPDLVAKIGLAARDWPDGIVGGATFNAQSISTARGSTVTTGDLGTATLTFPTVSVTSTGGNLTYQTVTTPGAPLEGLGIVGAGGVLAITSANSGSIKLGFNTNAVVFAVTLADFGKNGAFADRAELSFLNSSGIVIGTATLSGCSADGGLATFSVPSPTFRSVVVKALPAIDASSNTATTSFLISEVQACDSTATFCTTPLSTSKNRCPYP